MLNLLYIGAFPPDFLVKRSNGKVDSLYRASQSLLKGFRERSDVNLMVITSPDLPSWPKGPLLLKREIVAAEKLVMVSSLNISILKQFWTIITMTTEAIKYIKKSNGPVVVMIPYIVFRHVYTLRILKALFKKRVIQAILVPDIFFPKKLFHRFVNFLTENTVSKFDAFVLYTNKMADYLKIHEGRYEVIEGFREVTDRVPVEMDAFNIVYTGSLNTEYGIGRPLDAMSIIKDNDVHLHLYGSGSAEQLIKDKSSSDCRIHYYGKVTNAEATDAIYSASVLINPRNANDGVFTEYSFPSKDIEYLATGIPVLLCKLPGMPLEYYNHFIDIDEGMPEQIAQAISRVKNMSKCERNQIGRDSREFIKHRMNLEYQTDRIISLLNRVINIRSLNEK